MAVPAHDFRDHEFALKYHIPITKVVKPFDASHVLAEPYTGDGFAISSSNQLSGLDINGLSCKEGASQVIIWLESSGHGKKKVFLCIYLDWKFIYFF